MYNICASQAFTLQAMAEKWNSPQRRSLKSSIVVATDGTLVMFILGLNDMMRVGLVPAGMSVRN